MKKKNVWICLFLFLVAACTKPDPASPVASAALVTAHGTPSGAAVTKTIGVSGGSIVSEDGNFSIIIPAGALAGDQEISVQPVINQLPAGYGRAYRNHYTLTVFHV
ncbi:hypothetical protein [Niabella sp.]|uniref:hypothetical protein n=1 Tax=Niabella sp. TaxID=1962976 RepID=UPI0026111A29|nr:hypothetical protein [Niabella sp.]